MRSLFPTILAIFIYLQGLAYSATATSVEYFPISEVPVLYQPDRYRFLENDTARFYGENLQHVTTLTIGEYELPFIIVSNQQINVPWPEGLRVFANTKLKVFAPMGNAQITLETAGAPGITTVSGGHRPGSTLTISGTHMLGVDSVHFDDIPAQSFEIISNTTLKCVVPVVTEKTITQLKVKGLHGTASYLLDVVITPAPEVLSASPLQIRPGEYLTITGKNFSETAFMGSVYIGAIRIPYHDTQFIDANTAIVRMPEFFTGNPELEVKVINEGGLSGSKLFSFNIEAPIAYRIENVSRSNIIPGIHAYFTGFLPPYPDSVTLGGVRVDFTKYDNNRFDFTFPDSLASGILTLHESGKRISYPDELIATDFQHSLFTFSPRVATIGSVITVSGFSSYVTSVEFNGRSIPFTPELSYDQLSFTVAPDMVSGTITVNTHIRSFQSSEKLVIKPSNEVKPVIYSIDAGGPLDDYIAKIKGHNLSNVTKVRLGDFYSDFQLLADDSLLITLPSDLENSYLSSYWVILESPAGQTYTNFYYEKRPTRTISSVSPTSGQRGSIVYVTFNPPNPYINYNDTYPNFYFGETPSYNREQVNDTTWRVEVPWEGDVEGRIGVYTDDLEYSDIVFSLSDEQYCECRGAHYIKPLKKLMIRGRTFDLTDEPYLDSTGVILEVIPGQVLRFGFIASEWPGYSKVFADFNNNKIFDEPGASTLPGRASYPLPADTMVYVSLRIPDDAATGNDVRLRIVTSQGQEYILPCGLLTFGQAIDYTLRIVAPSESLKIYDFYPSIGAANSTITVMGDNLHQLNMVTLDEVPLAIAEATPTTATVIVPEGVTNRSGQLYFHTSDDMVVTSRQFTIDTSIREPNGIEKNFEHIYRATVNGTDVSFFSYFNPGAGFEGEIWVEPVGEHLNDGTLCIYTPGGKYCFEDPIDFVSTINFPDPFIVTGTEPILLTGTNLLNIQSVTLDGFEAVPFTIIDSTSFSITFPPAELISRLLQVTLPSAIFERTITYPPPPDTTSSCDNQVHHWKEGVEVIKVDFEQISRSSGKSETEGYSDYSGNIAIVDRYKAYYTDVVLKNFSNNSIDSWVEVFISTSDTLLPQDRISAHVGGTTGGRLTIYPQEEMTVHPYFLIPDTIPAGVPVSCWFVVSHFPTGCDIEFGEIEKYSIIVSEDIDSDLEVLTMSDTVGTAGDVINITGVGFDNLKSVRVGTHYVPFTIESSTSISFTLTENTKTGNVAVISYQDEYEFNKTLEVVYPHSITSIGPAYGKAGDWITISGDNFSYVNKADFVNAPDADVWLLSNQLLKVQVPEDAKTGPITLTNLLLNEVESDVFSVLEPADAGVTDISVTNLESCTTSHDIVFAIKNFGETPIYRLMLNWSLNGVMQTNAWTGILASGETTELTIASAALRVGVPNILEAQTDWPNQSQDINTMNDTFARQVATKMSGAFTIGGTDPDFTTIGAATAVLNSVGVCGPVKFLIRPGVYEEQITINSVPGATAAAPVIFQSETGNKESVTIRHKASSEADNFVWKLNNTSHITLQQMTFHALDSNFCNRIMLVGTLSRVRIVENEIRARLGVSHSGGGYKGGIRVYNALLSGCSFMNNYIIGGETGVQIFNDISNYTEVEQDSIMGNVIKDDVFSITMNSRSNFLISGNEGEDAIFLSKMKDCEVANNRSFEVAVGESSSAVNIHHNRLNRMNIYESSDVWVTNNVIVATDIPVNLSEGALEITEGGGNKVFHNTIINFETPFGKGVVIRPPLDASKPLEFKNNIIYNLGGSSAISLHEESLQQHAVIMDHNNIYSPLTAPFVLGRTGNILFPTFFSTLAAWQDFSGQELHSLSIDPKFVSFETPDATALELVGRGTGIPSVTTDFYGQPRDPYFPAIGAKELSTTLDMGLTATSPVCNGFTTLSVVNNSLVPVAYFLVDWSINGIAQPIDTVTLDPPLGHFDTYSHPLYFSLDDTLDNNSVVVTIAQPNFRSEPDETNNTITSDFTVTPPVTLSADSLYSCNQPIAIEVADEYVWYSWTQPSGGSLTESQHIVALEPGWYNVTALDAEGCVSYDSVHVTVERLTTSLQHENRSTICSGNPLQLAASVEADSATLTYAWKHNGVVISNDLDIPAVELPGRYSFTIETANCTASDSITLQATEYPEARAVSPSDQINICEGTIAVLSVFEESPLHTYQWSKNGLPLTNGTDREFFATAAGHYHVAISAGECAVNSDTTQVIVTQIPDKLVVELTGIAELCDDDSVVLSVPASGLFSYQWNNATANTTNSITVFEAGDYFVQVSNGLCSVYSDTVHVSKQTSPDKPVVSGGTSDQINICEGSIAVLSVFEGSPLHTYQWLKDGLPLTNATDLEFSATETGHYQVAIYAGACAVNSDATQVVVTEMPDKPVVEVTGIPELCDDDSVVLSVPASGLLSYQWNNAAANTTNSITVFEAGDYFVQVSNGLCSVYSDSVHVSKQTSPGKPVISGDTTICEGTSTDLVAPGDYTGYLWSNGATSQAISVSEGGSYSVVVYNGGCASESANSTVYATPYPARDLQISGGTITAGPADTYEWFHDQNVLNQNEQQLTIEAAGKYFAILATGGCFTTTDTVEVVLTDIKEQNTQNPVSIHPIPANQTLTLKVSGLFDEHTTIKFIDAVGTIHYPEMTKASADTITISLDNLASGIYFVQVSLAEIHVIEKVIVQH